MTICRKVSMKNAVIYARYSSDKQNEMSIEGQIEECQRYAASNDLLIVQEYIDRAQSAKTDRRPEFLRMIADSEFGNFEVITSWIALLATRMIPVTTRRYLPTTE